MEKPGAEKIKCNAFKLSAELLGAYGTCRMQISLHQALLKYFEGCWKLIKKEMRSLEV